MTDQAITLFFSLMLYTAGAALILSMFRMPESLRWDVIALIGLPTGAISYYFKFILHSQWFFLTTVICMVLLIMLVLRVPILYSALMVVIGIGFCSLLDIVISTTIYQLGLMERGSAPTGRWIMYGIQTIAIILTIIFLESRRIGFMFVVRKFAMRNMLSPSNYSWALVLLVLLTYLQVSTFSFDSVHHYIILVGLAGVLLLATYVTLRKNYEQLSKSNKSPV